MTDRKNLGFTAGLIVVGAIGGGVLASTLTAGAQTTTTSPPASSSQSTTTDPAAPRAGHRGGGQRTDETLLTGDNAAKAKAAALKELPGATVERVETEADGNGVYEAHVTKADGTRATVFFDKDFKVTSVQDGMRKGQGD
jgi:hypothetical protein